jgi:hypothetical protein
VDLPGIDQTCLSLPHGGLGMRWAEAVACSLMHESDGVKVVMEMAGEDMAAARYPAHFKTGLNMKEIDGRAGHGQADRPERGRASWKKLRFLPVFSRLNHACVLVSLKS